MKDKTTLKKLGEIEIIRIIEDFIYNKMGKKLIRDDSFFFSLNKLSIDLEKNDYSLIFNSDMLVSSTDVPPEMDYYHIGRKVVIMNISDLIVKGVKPKGIMISFGLNGDLKLSDFKELLDGIIDTCIKWDIEYIGGDINESNELIINPTVFGFQLESKIIYRIGLKPGDYLIANGKFGLTGVGFDIIFNKKGNLEEYSKFKRSIKSVLEPGDLSPEALILSEKNLATSSIDSSDGLGKSLIDLIDANQNTDIGFEINLNDDLIDKEAIEYSEKFNFPLEKLVFNGGEEFIHLFTIGKKDLEKAQKAVENSGGYLFKIGKVISEKKIYYLHHDMKFEVKNKGFEHFK